jgi:sulfane dehydrogenase subunit SoxC
MRTKFSDEQRNLDYVAGNGLLHRRALFRGGAAAFVGALGAGAGLKTTAAAGSSLAEADWGLAPGDTSQSRTPHQLLDGMITPNGVFFTIVHDGVPAIDPSKHQLLIHGLVKRSLIFSYEVLLRYPMTSRVAQNAAGLSV